MNAKTVMPTIAIILFICAAAVMVIHAYRAALLSQEVGATKAILAAFTIEVDSKSDLASRLTKRGQQYELMGDVYTDWIEEMRQAGRLDPTGDAERDHWGNKYHVCFLVNDDRSSATVSSNGPDGIHGNRDDIVVTWSQEGS